MNFTAYRDITRVQDTNNKLKRSERKNMKFALNVPPKIFLRRHILLWVYQLYSKILSSIIIKNIKFQRYSIHTNIM